MQKNNIEFKGLGKACQALCLLVLVFVCLFSEAQAQAQTLQPPIRLSLSEAEKNYDIANHAYVIEDSDRSITYLKMLNDFNNGNRGNFPDKAVVDLGYEAKPHWIVIPIDNNTPHEDWVLSFGSRMDGRVGTIENILLGENSLKVKYLDTFPLQNGEVNEAFVPRTYFTRVRLPRDKNAFLAIYVVPKAGLPLMLPLKLVEEKQFFASMNAMPLLRFSPGMGMLCVVGFFAAAVILRRMWIGVAFMAYFVLQYVYFNHHNMYVYDPSQWGGQMSGVLFNAALIAGLISTKLFLRMGKIEHVQFRLIMTMIIAQIIAVLAALFVVPATGQIQVMVMYGPGVFSTLFMALLSMAQAKNQRPGAYQFALAWFCLFAGYVLPLAAFAKIVEFSPDFMVGYWWALIPHGVFLITATITRHISIQKDEFVAVSKKQEEEEALDKLRQTKESVEVERLLKVLDHERQFMNELQEREVKQNEELREAKVRADDANSAKSAFLAVVSHEIRTPMTGVMGMVHLMQKTSLTPEQRKYMQTVQDSGEAMMTLLNDILDFEKIETGKLEIEHVDFDVHRLCQSVITLMSGHASSKNIYLKLDLDHNVPQFLNGDPTRLRQVLLNLTGNAIKFTQEGGVTLRVKSLLSGASKENNADVASVFFGIIDTGIGISEEGKEKLFTPFSQAESGTTRKFGGSGLGLTISQRLVTAMGGQIEIESKEGHGSTFYFVLNLREGLGDATSDETEMRVTVEPDRLMHILIVEDNEINQKLIKELVGRHGHETKIAGTGEEALDLVQKFFFDMILMDAELPDMNGIVVTRAIRDFSDGSKAETPIIALTGNVQASDVASYFQAGMNGHLAKPIDPKKLQKTLSDACHGIFENPIEKPKSGQRQQSGNEQDSADNVVLPGLNKGEKEDNLLKDVIQGAEEPATGKQGPQEEPEKVEASSVTSGDMDSFELPTIEKLCSDMGQIQFITLMDSVFDKTEEIMASINEALDNGDIDTITRRAHELKGMTGNFGLTKLAGIAAEIEKALKADGGPDISLKELTLNLPKAYERTKQQVTGWMNSNM